ncbi:MAG: hypothetical protein U1E73_01635 [Planctomycetota bacterium]
MRRSGIVAVVLGLAACAGTPSRTAPCVIACDTAGDLAAFDFTDAAAFRFARDDAAGDGCLELFQAAKYEPPFRSPLGLAIVRGVEFGDGVLRVKARQTGREYPHRDLVFVIGYVDSAHFVYAHLATKGDDNAHHLMLVDGAARRPVTTWRTEGVQWGGGWHDVAVRRRGTHVEVSFDGASVLVGEVPAWRGRVGVGSFDDTGRFRELVVVGAE